MVPVTDAHPAVLSLLLSHAQIYTYTCLFLDYDVPGHDGHSRPHMQPVRLNTPVYMLTALRALIRGYIRYRRSAALMLLREYRILKTEQASGRIG